MSQNSNNKDLRNIIFAVGLVMGFIFLASLLAFVIQDKYGISCSCKVSLNIIIPLLSSLGIFVGILTYYFLSKSFSKQKKQLLGNVEKTLSFLNQDEKAILKVLINNNGEVAQNILGKKSKIDPVKLHRKILNLESKGILQKKKNGMTNKIILHKDMKELFLK